MDESDVGQWFGRYVDAVAACGRGESDAESLLAYCGVPLLFATDDEFVALTSDQQVAAALQRQIDGMRAADYDHSDILHSETTVLNATSALHRGTFSRRRSDGGEIGQLTATYLVPTVLRDAASGRSRYTALDGRAAGTGCLGRRLPQIARDEERERRCGSAAPLLTRASDN